jgi:hypothetical protein
VAEQCDEHVVAVGESGQWLLEQWRAQLRRWQ